MAHVNVKVSFYAPTRLTTFKVVSFVNSLC
jgi:hypothetical protein